MDVGFSVVLANWVQRLKCSSPSCRSFTPYASFFVWSWETSALLNVYPRIVLPAKLLAALSVNKKPNDKEHE